MRPKKLMILNADGKPKPPDGPTRRGIDTQLVDFRVRLMPRTPYDRLLCDVATVDAAERAIAAGSDGLFIDSFGDYGIDAIRSCTDIPVTGAGEVAIERAARYGRFAVVTVWPPSMRHIYAERLATVAGGECCVTIHHLSEEEDLDGPGTASSIHRRATAGETEIARLAADACRVVADRADVDAVVLGCTCMSTLATRVAADCPVPVIDPFTAGYERALGLVGDTADRRPRTGANQCAHTRHAGRVQQLVDGWSSGGPDLPDETCGVCVSAEPGS